MQTQRWARRLHGAGLVAHGGAPGGVRLGVGRDGGDEPDRCEQSDAEAASGCGEPPQRRPPHGGGAEREEGGVEQEGGGEAGECRHLERRRAAAEEEEVVGAEEPWAARTPSNTSSAASETASQADFLDSLFA